MTRISLVVSDVDGTLVTPDKRLTDVSVCAARQLSQRGIGLTIVSSRPPTGIRMLVEPPALWAADRRLQRQHDRDAIS